MSDYQHKPNRGSVFANDKQGNPNRPDFRGDANIDGVLYNISIWEGATQKGTPKLSMQFERKQDKPPAQHAEPRQAARLYPQAPSTPADDPLDDDLPF